MSHLNQHVELAQQAFRDGRFLDLKQILESALCKQQELSDRDRAELLILSSNIQLQSGEHGLAEASSREALSICVSEPELGQECADSVVNLARSLQAQKRLPEAEMVLSATLDDELSLCPNMHRPHVIAELSTLIQFEGDLEAEWDLLGAAMVMCGLPRLRCDWAFADVYSTIGDFFVRCGDYDEAEGSYEIALSAIKNAYSHTHPYVTTIEYRQGRMYEKLGLFDEALAKYETCIKSQSDPQLLNRFSLADSLVDAAGLLADRGEYLQALDYLNRATQIFESNPVLHRDDLAAAIEIRAWTLASKGDQAEAISAYEEAIAFQQEYASPDHMGLSETYYRFGEQLHLFGLVDKAYSTLREALLLENVADETRFEAIARKRLALGEVQFDLGDYSAAKISFEGVLQWRECLDEDYLNNVLGCIRKCDEALEPNG